MLIDYDVRNKSSFDKFDIYFLSKNIKLVYFSKIVDNLPRRLYRFCNF